MTPEALFANLTYQRTADVYSGRLTSLHHMALKGDHRGVLRLIKAGAFINMESSDHGTPLMTACRYGRFRVARLLVRRKALLTYEKDGVLFSAVQEAAAYPEIVRWILVERYTDQFKLKGPTAGTDAATTLDCESDESFAPATSFGPVPWNTHQFIPSERLDGFVRSKLASFRSGTFYCREDGHITLVPNGSHDMPWVDGLLH
ncbi:hypothetical protein PRZ48_010825 [Zasmidium cellare]|uniref:Uncharacterized protein n=1 Tax=Zasmidium cellare TaxID=395010 RepID=A0ABR0E9Q3_ZASCE|nr:hypothetical protein PRZ48_010825 [Zasmidium cellare]